MGTVADRQFQAGSPLFNVRSVEIHARKRRKHYRASVKRLVTLDNHIFIFVQKRSFHCFHAALAQKTLRLSIPILSTLINAIHLRVDDASRMCVYVSRRARGKKERRTHLSLFVPLYFCHRFIPLIRPPYIHLCMSRVFPLEIPPGLRLAVCYKCFLYFFFYLFSSPFRNSSVLSLYNYRTPTRSATHARFVSSAFCVFSIRNVCVCVWVYVSCVPLYASVACFTVHVARVPIRCILYTHKRTHTHVHAHTIVWVHVQRSFLYC